MSYTVNNTTLYHKENIETLGWELTVCNSLEPMDSPCRGILKNNSTFGNLLYNYLSKYISFTDITNIIEIGGGYGFLMRDFLTKNQTLKGVMLDISKFLLNKQSETLKGFDVKFLESDFFQADEKFLKKFDLAILNENIGDFPTICNIEPESFNLPEERLDPLLLKIKTIFHKYSLKMSNDAFNFNIGAIEAVEKLCASGIKYIYMSEHSCESKEPEEYSNKININPTGNPQRIILKGHDEYTIKFSYLEDVAKSFNYTVIRGQFKDFLEIDYSDRLNFILTSNSQKDEHEIIRLFIDDLFKYEYLILTRVDIT